MNYKILRWLSTLAGRLPWTILRRLADILAFFFWHFVPSRRREAIEAISKHLKLPPAEAKLMARQSFRENFLSFLEIIHAGRFFTDQSVRVVYTPEVKAAIQSEKRPIIITTAHLGSWEMMPGLAADILPEREGMVVVRSRKNPVLNRILADLRGARGMLVIDHRKAVDVLLSKLRKGGAAAFLVDHNTNRREAVFLPFLEDVAAVNMGPASIALRVKAAVYPVFLLRDGKGGHILHMLPPLRTEEMEGDVKQRVRNIARFYTEAVDEMVRRYPEQWFWMHKRWKTREDD
ncbi:MAG: lysophospholipid acyltransferase family protein [Desulfovibrio sp.]|nr:lysophospholipid acyltransferase family protein [Desulfovibrio sp.]